MIKISTGERQNFLAALSYLFGFLSGIVVLFLVKKNNFIRFHALQSVMIFLILFFLTVFFELLPFFGAYLGAAIVLLSLGVCFFLFIVALRGKRYKLPWIGNFVEETLNNSV